MPKTLTEENIPLFLRAWQKGQAMIDADELARISAMEERLRDATAREVLRDRVRQEALREHRAWMTLTFFTGYYESADRIHQPALLISGTTPLPYRRMKGSEG